MNAQTRKIAGQTSAHIDSIPEGALTRGLCISIVLFAVAWLVIVGSTWNSGA